jgi:large subunit ribosomal protein L35
MKTRKSITKRFKITKNGKILRRATGQDHCLAKKSSDARRKSKKWITVSAPLAKRIRELIR